jgi:hypothetical protein
MALIDPTSAPINLPTSWLANLRRGSRLLFWTLLVSPLLMSLTEFFFKVGLTLSRSEENATMMMAWDKWAPLVPLVIGLGSLTGVWMFTRPVEGKLKPRQELRRQLVRPATLMMFAVLMLQAASGLTDVQNQSWMFEWLPRVVATCFVALFLMYVADVANILDQYPLKVVALTMAAYFVCVLGCDVLDLLLVGSEFGAFVLPVVAMGKLALAMVSMVGLVLVLGKLHRLLRMLQNKA